MHVAAALGGDSLRRTRDRFLLSVRSPHSCTIMIRKNGILGPRSFPMSYRFLISIVALTAIALPAAAQAPSSAAKPAAKTTKTWTLPRTADGRPDLQGVWLSKSATPLERPKELEGRQSLTDAEVAELKKRADRLFKNGNSDYAAGDSAFLAALANPEHYKSTTATGGSGAMVERGFDNRTAPIVDAADGTISPLTPAPPPREAAGRRHPAG